MNHNSRIREKFEIPKRPLPAKFYSGSKIDFDKPVTKFYCPITF